MKIKFFEYTKNCEEFKILVKATSENASRKDLKEGQILFEAIYQNIKIIDAQLSKINESITCRKVEIHGLYQEEEILQRQEFTIQYDPNLDERIEIYIGDRIFSDIYSENYYELIYPHIKKVLLFLNSDFAHETFKTIALDWEKGIAEGKRTTVGNVLENHYIETYWNGIHYKISIEKSIEKVLEYYAKISFKLKEYIDLFLKNK